jgi:predicted GNAT family acetyltransferase
MPERSDQPPPPAASGGPARPEATLVDVPEASRYELRVDGAVVAWVDYALRPGRIVAVHTEVPSEHQGRGYGSRIVRLVLDEARRTGRTVTPVCPLFRAHFERHPEDLDLRAGPRGVPR